MVIIRWDTNTSFRSHKRGPVYHTQPHMMPRKWIRWEEELTTAYTHYRQNIPHNHLLTLLELSSYVLKACEQIYSMMIMWGMTYQKNNANPKTIMYPAHDTYYRLHSISGNKTKLIRYPSEWHRQNIAPAQITLLSWPKGWGLPEITPHNPLLAWLGGIWGSHLTLAGFCFPGFWVMHWSRRRLLVVSWENMMM